MTVDRRDTDWAAYWDANERAVFYFLLRLTFGHRHEAEDYLQETFIRAWRWFEQSPEEPAPPRQWLFTVARRIVIDAVRARKARPAENLKETMADVDDRRNDIERFVEIQTVRQAMLDLRPLYREALFELYYRERTIAEAAEALGIPEGTVKSRVHNGLRQLRETVRSHSAERQPVAV